MSSFSRLAERPSTTDTDHDITFTKWLFDNGNNLSVTSTPDKKITFIEADWGGNSAASKSDFPGLTYGKTTLAELRERFGSNG